MNSCLSFPDDVICALCHGCSLSCRSSHIFWDFVEVRSICDLGRIFVVYQYLCHIFRSKEIVTLLLLTNDYAILV